LANRIAGSVACLNLDWSVGRCYSHPDASLELGEGYLHPLRRELQPLFTTWSGIHEPLRATQLNEVKPPGGKVKLGGGLSSSLKIGGPKSAHSRNGILTDSFRCSLRLLERLLAAIPSPLSFPPFWRASSTPLVLIEADGDESTMNFVAVITKLKSDLTRFCAKESVLNNELRRTPYTRSSQNASSTTFVNKGKKRKGWGLTLRPFADGSRITLGPRNLVVKLAKAKLI
jgi:hypothetical protein